jgi:hypothetical protein
VNVPNPHDPNQNAPTIRLGQIAHARSGDKGNHANIGVAAHTHEGYEYLAAHLSAERVAEFFAGLSSSRVERFELPNLDALNFLLYNALDGGASRSPRIDTQGKLLGTAILELPLPSPAPERLAAMQPEAPSQRPA